MQPPAAAIQCEMWVLFPGWMISLVAGACSQEQLQTPAPPGLILAVGHPAVSIQAFWSVSHACCGMCFSPDE